MGEHLEWMRSEIRAAIARHEADKNTAITAYNKEWWLGVASRHEGSPTQATWHFDRAEEYLKAAHEHSQAIGRLKAQLRGMTGPDFGSDYDWVPPGAPSPLDRLPRHADRVEQERRNREAINAEADRRNREAINQPDLFERLVDRAIDFGYFIRRLFGWDK